MRKGNVEEIGTVHFSHADAGIFVKMARKGLKTQMHAFV